MSMEIFSLQNKVAIVTGGGSGIGKAIALLFAQRGATVVIVELNESAAQQTVTAIQQGGGKALAYGCNVADQPAVVHCFAKVAANHGRIDILVNCAGIAQVGKLENTAEADFDRVYQVNVKGTYNCMYAVIGQMKQQGGGVILNLASIASSIGLPDRFAYSMSKGAVLAMTYSVAKDYIGDKIRCNCISPARVHTPFVDGFLAKNYPSREQQMYEQLSRTQPIGRMARPEEVAYLALYLCADESGFVTGCDYPIDGGFIKLNN